jgi:hypothetical protein
MTDEDWGEEQPEPIADAGVDVDVETPAATPDVQIPTPDAAPEADLQPPDVTPAVEAPPDGEPDGAPPDARRSDDDDIGEPPTSQSGWRASCSMPHGGGLTPFAGPVRATREEAQADADAHVAQSPGCTGACSVAPEGDVVPGPSPGPSPLAPGVGWRATCELPHAGGNPWVGPVRATREEAQADVDQHVAAYGDHSESCRVATEGSPAVPIPVPAPTTPRPSLSSDDYVVRAGDTLSLIASRHGVALHALIAANPQISNPDRIWAGQVVHIPRQG